MDSETGDRQHAIDLGRWLVNRKRAGKLDEEYRRLNGGRVSEQQNRRQVPS